MFMMSKRRVHCSTWCLWAETIEGQFKNASLSCLPVALVLVMSKKEHVQGNVATYGVYDSLQPKVLLAYCQYCQGLSFSKF